MKKRRAARKQSIPVKTIERLALYRRILNDAAAKEQIYIYSHTLAELAHNSPAQVRRDLMVLGYTGTPKAGYVVKKLIEAISFILDDKTLQKIALIGIGNLGRAILSYFSCRHPSLSLVAAFDFDETKTNRVIGGCRCYHMREFEQKIKEENITLGIITVPAEGAQAVADKMCASGIRGILNFAPVPIKVPDNVFLDRIDITMALEKVAFFAKQKFIKFGENNEGE